MPTKLKSKQRVAKRDVRLASLAARIRAEHKAFIGLARKSLDHAFNAGNLLIEAKAKLDKHGQWLPWLRKHCPFSERIAVLDLFHAPVVGGPTEVRVIVENVIEVNGIVGAIALDHRRGLDGGNH